MSKKEDKRGRYMRGWTPEKRSEQMRKVALALHKGMSAEKKRERAMKMVAARVAKKNEKNQSKTKEEIL
jgi:hypothetical protein